MSSKARGSDSSTSITIVQEGDLYVATDEETGVVSQGATRHEALANLADALELHAGGGERIEDPDEFLSEIGVESDVDEESAPPWLS